MLHRDGVMRLATAADEILPLKDPRVQQNPAYLTIIVLARVITRLGSLPIVNTKVVEGLFASDLSYLQALYERLNGDERRRPRSGTVRRGGRPARPRRRPTSWGERPVKAYPVDQLYEEMAFIAYHFHWPRDELMALGARRASPLVRGDLVDQPPARRAGPEPARRDVRS